MPISKEATLNSVENHVFHLFVVRTKNRTALQQHLLKSGIHTVIHYPIPPHKQQAYKSLSELDLHLTVKIHDEVLSLPLSPVMTDEQIKKVISVCNEFKG